MGIAALNFRLCYGRARAADFLAVLQNVGPGRDEQIFFAAHVRIGVPISLDMGNAVAKRTREWVFFCKQRSDADRMRRCLPRPIRLQTTYHGGTTI